MTNKEAQEYGKMWLEMQDDSKNSCTYKFFVTAIKALEQKPSISEDGTLTVNVEDGSKVSRVLVCGDNHFGGLYYPDQEPKAGHWIRVTDKTGHLVWECDKCGWQQRFNTNFCPDCGAKMESEDK